MKVLFMDHSLKPVGGGQKSLLLLARKFLENRTVQPHILVGDETSWLSKEATKAGIPTHKINIPNCLKNFDRGNIMSALLSPVSVCKGLADYGNRIYELVSAEGIDIIHSNDGLMRVVGAWIRRYKRVPHVAHIRDIYPPKYSLRIYLELVGRFTDRFICVSQATVMALPLSLRNKCRVVYNGVSSYTAPKQKVLGNDIVLLSAGRLVAWKGFDLLLDVARKMLEHPIGRRAVFIIAGDGPLYESLREDIRRDPILQNNVRLLGYREDLPELMASATVFVHTAREPDPFPRVVLEALASGLPVFGFAQGGVTEAVPEPHFCLVEPMNTTALAERLVSVIRDDTKLSDLSKMARERSKEFSVDSYAQGVRKTYLEILENGSHE